MESSIESDGGVCEPSEVDEQEKPVAGDSEVLEVMKVLKVFCKSKDIAVMKFVVSMTIHSQSPGLRWANKIFGSDGAVEHRVNPCSTRLESRCCP